MNIGWVGKIISSAIGKNRNSGTESILLQVEITDPKDIQTIQAVSQSGEDTNPPPLSTAFVLKFGSSNMICIGSDDGLTPDVAPGEKEFYATQSVVVGGKLISRTKLARLKFKSDGTFAVDNGIEGLKGLMADMLTEMKNLTTTGSPASQAIDAASKLRIDLLQARFDLLIGDI